MLDAPHLNWQAIAADPRFQRLQRRKTAVLVGLLSFSVLYYFLLPIGAAYFQDWFRLRISGPLNLGLVFALSEFLAAWWVAWYYARCANRDFDALAADLAQEAARMAERL